MTLEDLHFQRFIITEVDPTVDFRELASPEAVAGAFEATVYQLLWQCQHQERSHLDLSESKVEPVEKKLDPADTVADIALVQSAPIIDNLLAPIKHLVEESTSFESVRERLFELYPTIDTKDFAELMGQAMIVAETAGRFEVLEETGEDFEFAELGRRLVELAQGHLDYSFNPSQRRDGHGRWTRTGSSKPIKLTSSEAKKLLGVDIHERIYEREAELAAKKVKHLTPSVRDGVKASVDRVFAGAKKDYLNPDNQKQIEHLNDFVADVQKLSKGEFESQPQRRREFLADHDDLIKGFKTELLDLGKASASGLKDDNPELDKLDSFLEGRTNRYYRSKRKAIAPIVGKAESEIENQVLKDLDDSFTRLKEDPNNEDIQALVLDKIGYVNELKKFALGDLDNAREKEFLQDFGSSMQPYKEQVEFLKKHSSVDDRDGFFGELVNKTEDYETRFNDLTTTQEKKDKVERLLAEEEQLLSSRKQNIATKLEELQTTDEKLKRYEAKQKRISDKFDNITATVKSMDDVARSTRLYQKGLRKVQNRRDDLRDKYWSIRSELIGLGLPVSNDYTEASGAGKTLIATRDLLLNLKKLIETRYITGITAIKNAYVDANDAIRCQFEDRVSDRLTLQFDCTITTSEISYELINEDEARNFSERSVNSLDFATAPKKLNCNPAKSFQCGNSCQQLGRNCKSNPTPAQAIATQTIVAGAKAANPSTTPAAKTKKTTAKTSKAAATPLAPPTVPAVPTSPVKTNDVELNKSRADLVQRFGQKTVDVAEANVQKILADKDTSVFVRVGSSATLEKILGDRFRTSAELGVDTHQIPHLRDGYQKARNRVEEKTLGYDSKNTNPEDRPIYGYLGGKDLNGASHTDPATAYGSITVKLRSEVKDRATFTGSDSFKSGVASEVINQGTPPPPNAASLVSTTRHGYDRDKLPKHYPSFYADKSTDKGQLAAAAKAKTIDDLAPALATTGNKYVEAQVHGKVTPSDIAEIHFNPTKMDDRPTAAVAKWAKDNNIDLFVGGKKTNPDDIINPKNKRTKVNELSDALAGEDFSTVAKIADDIYGNAQKLKLAPGEDDNYLKQLFIDSGYDNLPKIVDSSDVTKTWQSGGHLIVRGMARGSKTRTDHFDSFKTGDYFTGNGIYGNGTYVSAANGSTSKDAVDAIKTIRTYGYSNSSGVTLRAALPSDANVVDAKQLTQEIKDFKKKFDTWATTERQNVLRSTAGIAPAKLKKESDSIRKSLDIDSPQTQILQTTRHNGIPANLVEVTIPPKPGTGGTGMVFKMKVDLAGLHTVILPDGSEKTVSTQKKAIALFTQDYADNRALLKLAASNSSAVQAFNDFDSKVKRIKKALLGDEQNGTSGRFAVAKGYDAVKLSQSYAPDNFMLLLNRSKVLVQDGELKYNSAIRDVVG